MLPPLRLHVYLGSASYLYLLEEEMHKLDWMCRWAGTVVNLAHVGYVTLV